jgi:SAM-dependent methyltransferase
VTTSARQKQLYDRLWDDARPEAFSPDLMRLRVWKPHLVPPVADIGAGDALLARLCLGTDVISVDLSATGLRQGRPRAVAGAAEAIPLRTGSMRTVVLSEVIEHSEDPALVLRECRRVLARDGRFLLSAPLWPLAHAERAYHHLRTRERPTLENIAVWDPHHERRYRLADLVRLTESAGFSVERTRLLFGSASTTALYFVEPLVTRITGRRPRLAQRMVPVDRLVRRLDHASGAALVCRPATTPA